MEIIDLTKCENKEKWLIEIENSDWSAGKYLSNLFYNDTFYKTMGDDSKVLLLINDGKLISYCTYSQVDCIKPTEFSPWIGFVYTYPEFRGNGYIGLLFKEIEKIAKLENISKVYLATDHIGLYEKYGFVYLKNMDDVFGNVERVYYKTIV